MYHKRFKRNAYTRKWEIESMEKIDELDLMGFNVNVSVRIDEEMKQKLHIISLFTKIKEGSLLRQWTHEKIRVFYRNPEFKRWLNKLALIPLAPQKPQKKTEK